MKNRVILILIIGLFVYSCGSADKKARLESLKEQRDKLTGQINNLEKELEKEVNGEVTEEKLAKIKIRKLKSQSFYHYIEVQGNTESDNNIFVPAETAGLVKKIFVKEGDKVIKGQLLAELDGTIFEKGIEELKNGLELATTVYERQKRLWDKKIGSEIQYLQTKNQKEGLEKKLETTMEQYNLTKITSPIDGTVDEITIKEGESAAPGFGAIRIVQLTALKIKAALSETYIRSVHKRDSVKIEIPVLNKSFYHTVNAVSQVINPDNRTFSVEIKVPSTQKDIKPNMHTVITINDYINPYAIVVPIKILQTSGDKYFLFVAENQENNRWIAKKRTVTPGKYYMQQIEIVSGLETGENIIIVGYQNLADGQTVEIGI